MILALKQNSQVRCIGNAFAGRRELLGLLVVHTCAGTALERPARAAIALRRFAVIGDAPQWKVSLQGQVNGMKPTGMSINHAQDGGEGSNLFSKGLAALASLYPTNRACTYRVLPTRTIQTHHAQHSPGHVMNGQAKGQSWPGENLKFY